jgi:hypothetical protein
LVHITAMSIPAEQASKIRAIDHAVLPVEALDVARARLTALGFTVAPDGIHSFGTENACVYFEDGTFIEPLGIAQREDCEKTARKGNVFTARDQAYRFRNGEDGFSALALATENASKDHKRFKKAGISAGRKLAFGRNVTTPSGSQAKAAFLLAFAADLRSPDCFFFTCQRIKTPDIDKGALLSQENTVTGIAEIIASDQNPTDFQYLLQDVLRNRETEAHSFGLQIAASNGVVNVMTPEGLEVHFGTSRESEDRGLRLEGIVLHCKSLGAVKTLLKKNGIETRKMQGQLVVDRAPGQGCFFVFRESTIA